MPMVFDSQIAMAFASRGCGVEVVCPSGHPALSTRAVRALHRYNAIAPIRSFRAALLQSRPEIVVPSDELAMRHLHRLYRIALGSRDDSAPWLREVLIRSLGDPASYALIESRDQFMAMIEREGIRAPETRTVASPEEVEAWLERFGFPAVLKADGTSGGEGVKIVHTPAEALRAYRTLQSPLAAAIVAKRAIFDRDWNYVMPWLAQRRRSISIQSFVTGFDANIAAACWQGEILASIAVEVLATARPKGPATVVRLLNNAAMSRAAETIVRELKFSGLCGFDFMLDKATGEAYLIEMNARATQTSPLSLGRGRDPIGSLYARIGGEPAPSTPVVLRNDRIALFPQAWQGDTTSEMFAAAHHDIPWEEPELVRLGMQQVRKFRNEKWVQLFSKIGLYQP